MKKKSKIVSSEVSRKREKYEFLTLGHFGPLPPCEAHTPDLTLACYSPWGPEKNSLCSGGMGPHLGEIWEFEIFTIDT